MASDFQSRPIVLAAGGTGGHLFPAQALADELRRRSMKVLLVTDERGLKWREHFPDTELRHTVSGTVTRSGWGARLMGLLKLAVGTAQALALLTQKRPGAVVGFGGYPSLPTMLAAIIRRDATCIHEQNAVMGRANRLVAGSVSGIALAFPAPVGLSVPLAGKARVVGNPVRGSILELAGAPYRLLTPGGPIELLVFGGSQGASIFSSVLPAAVELLTSGIRARLRVVQQAREGEVEATSARYAALGIKAVVKPFFDDMPQRMERAHLVICRSGASTVSELSVIGRAAILVPLPGAIDGDQAANATRLAAAGGAWLMPQSDFNAQALASRLTELFGQPALLEAAAAAALSQGKPDAARTLADYVGELARPSRATVAAEEAA